MAIESSRIEPHWNYLLALDADLAQLARYVEFHQDNFACFSLEIARVLMAASAEVDVVAKQLCKVLQPESTAENILAYRDVIRAAVPQIPRFRLAIPRYGLSLVPWAEWKEVEGVPLWWTANNKVKHERHIHFHEACLKHALNALGGLLVLLLFLYRERATQGQLVPAPQIIRAGNEHIEGVNVGDVDEGIWYKLD